MSELQQSPETIQTYDLTQIVEAANLLMDAAIMTPSHIQAVFEQISYRIRLRMEGQDTIQQARAAEYEQLLTAWHVMSEIHEQRKQEDQNSISRLIWENYQLRTCLSDTDKHAIFKHNQACDLHDQLSNCTNSINNLKSQIDNNVATIDGLNAMLDSNNDIIANLRLQLVNNTVTINGLRMQLDNNSTTIADLQQRNYELNRDYYNLKEDHENLKRRATEYRKFQSKRVRMLTEKP